MMLRETVEAFTDLRAVFGRLTEEQASRVWLGVLGVRDTVIHIHRPATLRAQPKPGFLLTNPGLWSPSSTGWPPSAAG